MKQDWSRAGPLAIMTGVFIKRGDLATERYTDEHHAEMKAEVRAMLS